MSQSSTPSSGVCLTVLCCDTDRQGANPHSSRLSSHPLASLLPLCCPPVVTSSPVVVTLPCGHSPLWSPLPVVTPSLLVTFPWWSLPRQDGGHPSPVVTSLFVTSSALVTPIMTPLLPPFVASLVTLCYPHFPPLPLTSLLRPSYSPLTTLTPFLPPFPPPHLPPPPHPPPPPLPSHPLLPHLASSYSLLLPLTLCKITFYNFFTTFFKPFCIF